MVVLFLREFMQFFECLVLESPAVMAASSKADCTSAIQYSLDATDEEPSLVKLVAVRRLRWWIGS